MYKLFLTLRYLTRKKIVIFPILVVWLCVMMLIIVSGIMGGFVDRVRETNHDLLGDIIISSRSSALGFAHYDELRHALENKFPDLIEATTPTVEAYALIFVPDYQDSRPAILVGINPEERSKVTKFRESLFNQYSARTQAVEDLSPRLPATREELVQFAANHEKQALDQRDALISQWQQERVALMVAVPHPTPDLRWLWGIIPLALLIALLLLRIYWQPKWKRSGWSILGAIFAGLLGLAIIAAGVLWPIAFPRQFKLLEDQMHRADMDARQAERTQAFAEALPAGQYRSRQELTAAIVPPAPSFQVPPSIEAGPPALPPDGCIIGSQLGFFERDMRGNFKHTVGPLYMKVVMTVFPANTSGAINARLDRAQQQGFTIVDDSHTGVFDVDQTNVYAPLSVVQQLAGLAPDPEAVKQGAANFDPRCQEVLIKLKSSTAHADIRAIRSQIALFVEDFQSKHADMGDELNVQTWDEKQAKYLGAVQNEKVIIIFVLGMMSLVVLVVIFLIFYQIVRDKTRDIGIIKAVGGSEEGVAGIFLTFGLFIGVVGGGLGVLGGVLFVTHTNQIHEAIFQATGIVIWDRSVYLFDRIPDVVHLSDVVVYFVVAVVAGVLGALIPAIIAASQDPVQAVRYE